MMGWYNDGADWMLVMMVLWAALIAAAVWAVLALTRRHDRESQPTTARELLDRRLAGREISKQEYLEAVGSLAQAGKRT